MLLLILMGLAFQLKKIHLKWMKISPGALVGSIIISDDDKL